MESGASPPRHHRGIDNASGSTITPPGLVQTTTDSEEQRQSSSEPYEHENSADSGEQLRLSTSSAADLEDNNGDVVETPDSPPPFWTGTSRPISYQSISHLQRLHSGGPIQLEDHSEEDHVQAQSCWAESATIDEYVVVSGPTGIGAYVVWHCTVKTLKGGDLEIRKRYSEFATLRSNLVRSFPHAENMIPDLPRKSVVSRFRPRFLEARKRGLSHFLNCILLNPEFASSPVLKEFVFS